MRIGTFTALLAAALVFVVQTVALAQFQFVTNNGAITITGYSGAGGAVTIPATINSLPVTAIGDMAFWYMQGITSLDIPGSVTNIGGRAFGDCLNATNITIGNGVITIGNSAFYECWSLGQLVVPNTVTSIGDYAFRRCYGLTNITIGSGVGSIGSSAFADSGLTTVMIPGGVTNIGAFAFYDALSLKTIGVEPFNQVYSSLNGVLFNAAGTTLIQCPSGKIGSLTFPAGVASIADNAFAWCTGLTNINIGAGLTVIGNSAFYRSGVSTITMPQGVASIGNDAFYWCGGLTSISIPGSVTNIGSGAFYLCSNLTNTTLGTNIAILGPNAFAGCKLQSITVPTSLTNIGNQALASSALLNILVDALNPAYSSVDGVLFNKDQSVLVQFPLARAGAYTVPSGTSTILSNAFISSTGLTSVRISASLTNIGSGAFLGCTKLSAIFFQGDAPNLGASAFATNQTIYYLPGSLNWTSSFGGRPAVLWNPLINTVAASFGMQLGRFGFDIVGTTNIPIAVQVCTNMADPLWTILQTCKLTNGSIYFADPASTNSLVRFYRIQPP